MGVKWIVKSQEVIARLGAMSAAASNMTGVMRDFAGYMHGSIQRNFDAEGRPTRWAPLRLATKIAWHTSRKTYWQKSGVGMTKTGAAAWSGRKVLTDTARLRNSITATVRADGLEMGTNVRYAAIHQFGGTIPPIYPKSKKALFWAGAAHPVKKTRGGHIPARPYLLFQVEDIIYIKNKLIQHVMGHK